jgi:hypothetical protein
VARAKRTARADARRAYRASINAPVDELDDVEDGDPSTEAASAPAASRSSGSARQTAPAPAAGAARPRPSIGTAFRSAFRPLDLVGDLRALPRLLISWAFLIPAALIVAIAAVIIATAGQELISRELSQFFLAPPPLAPVFIAGFLASRASYLLGGLLGVVQTIAVLAIVATPSLGTVTGVPDTGTLASSALVSVVFGGFYAAAMAWYKRFLRAANPPRSAPPQKGSGQKSRAQVTARR